MSPADLADDADKTQNNKTQNETNSKTIQTSTCLSLRNNTACCIPLRDQRHLRENKYARVLHQSTKEPPISLADPADLRRQTPKPKATITTITTLTTTCLSLRYNAACCIPLRDLRHLRENKHARVLYLSPKKKPQCLPQISQIYADQTTKPH